MKVKFILPALTEAKSIYWRSIKYSLFPPLGLATLAGYLEHDDEITIEDEHVEMLNPEDYPDIVVIQVYITSAYRAYEIADLYRKRGAFVCLGGLHVTSLPEEAMEHADSIFIGPAEESWKRFLTDYKQKKTERVYISKERSLDNLPMPRRDLMKRDLYLVPNSIVVSRGCPHSCDFCYKENFYKGGKSFYTQKIDRVIEEIMQFKGRHLFFLDDHLFGNRKFALELFSALKGINKVWQAAGTVASVLAGELIQSAINSGLSSLFIGFETIQSRNLKDQNKTHNINTDYNAAVKVLHDSGVMINGSFVFGMDYDTKDVFSKTVEWALERSIETATFHILTPYPGTKLYNRFKDEKRITSFNWNKYDTRHAVFTPKGMTQEELENGYKTAYQDFYSWSSIFSSVSKKEDHMFGLRHLIYTSGWKKFEFLWEFIIRRQKIYNMIPLLEKVLSGKSITKNEIADQCKTDVLSNFTSLSALKVPRSAILK